MKNLYRIKVDYENNAEVFWGSIGTEYPAELEGILKFGDFHDEIWIITTHERIKEIESWLETVPGFHDGPQHAPTAILIYDEGEVEEISEARQ